MTDSVREFYDHLADEYHLIYADWRNSVRRQGAVLDRLIRAQLGDGPFRVLDATCGIGTQAIGLALRGHSVRATDLSGASVERARKEAADFGADVAFDVVDLRALTDRVEGPFDVVIACDNSLPHLVSDDELAAAARNVAAVLRPGGLFIASTRDYDAAVRTRPVVNEPDVFEGPDGRRIVLRVHDWAPDGRTYTITLLILRASPDGWDVAQHSTIYRALLRAELSAILAGSSFIAVRWHTPEETGFFQPIVTARRPG